MHQLDDTHRAIRQPAASPAAVSSRARRRSASAARRCRRWQRSNIVVAQPAENSVVWVSPRGTLEVLDDYAYWVAARSATSATSKRAAAGDPSKRRPAPRRSIRPGRHGLRLAGRLLARCRAGHPLVSVFEMGAYDVFDIAFQKGKPPASVKDLEGKTVVLGDRRVAGHRRSDGRPGRRRSTPRSSTSRRSASGARRCAGQADAALSWAGLRAQWLASGLDFDYILGKDWSKFPANSFSDPPLGLRGCGAGRPLHRYLRGWAWAGVRPPQPARRDPDHDGVEALAPRSTRPSRTSRSPSSRCGSWPMSSAATGRRARAGAGTDMEAWDLFLDTITRNRPAHQGHHGRRRHLSNDYVAGANDFDTAQVKADADRLRADRGVRRGDAAGRRRRRRQVPGWR